MLQNSVIFTGIGCFWARCSTKGPVILSSTLIKVVLLVHCCYFGGKFYRSQWRLDKRQKNGEITYLKTALKLQPARRQSNTFFRSLHMYQCLHAIKWCHKLFLFTQKLWNSAFNILNIFLISCLSHGPFIYISYTYLLLLWFNSTCSSSLMWISVIKMRMQTFSSTENVASTESLRQIRSANSAFSAHFT